MPGAVRRTLWSPWMGQVRSLTFVMTKRSPRCENKRNLNFENVSCMARLIKMWRNTHRVAGIFGFTDTRGVPFEDAGLGSRHVLGHGAWGVCSQAGF